MQRRDTGMTSLEEFGCHRPHCKATGVVTRVAWMNSVNEKTLCDCGLARDIAVQNGYVLAYGGVGLEWQVKPKDM